MRRSVLRTPVLWTAAVAGATTVAVTVLIACGGESERATAPAAARTHPQGVIVDCSKRSEADFSGAFAEPRNLVVGPLVLVGGAERTPASVIGRFGGQKFPLLVKAGHSVTVEISRAARRFAGLAYGPLPQGRVRLRGTHRGVTRGTPRTVTFVACRPTEKSGSSADGAVTFWSGFVLTRIPTCVPLEVYPDDQPSPRRAVLSLGAGRCRGQRAHRQATARKPCPPEGSEAVNFSAYYLGESFQGIPLERKLRNCRPPLQGEPGRPNYLSYIYGDCVATSDTGCAPPFELQSAPACERNLSQYRHGSYRLLKVRGVPAATFAGDVRLEVYTGDATVTIFAPDQSRVMEAAEALRSIPGSARSISAGVDLPKPVPGALEGRLPC